MGVLRPTRGKTAGYVQWNRDRKIVAKFSVEVPRNLEYTLELVRQDGNNLCQDAIADEMNTLTEMLVFEILERGAMISA